MLKLGQIALDGTKVKANASRHKALSYGHIEKIETQLRAEVRQLLAKAETADREALPDGLDVPSELARREERLKALAEAKAKIEERAQVRCNAEQKEYEAKVARREAQREAGKKPRQGTQAAAGRPRDRKTRSISPTKNRASCRRQVASSKSRLLIATSLTQQTNDKQQVEPMLEQVQALPEAVGQVEEFLADTGYFSEANVNACADRQISPLMAMGREAHHLPLEERFKPDAPKPESDDPVVQMAWRLTTKDGRARLRETQIHH